MRKVKSTPDVVMFKTFSYIVTGFLALVCLFPFLLVVSGSFTPEKTILSHGYSIIPPAFSTEAYQTIFEAPSVILRAYGVSLSLVVCGASIGLFITSMAGYVLHRKSFKYRNFFAFFFFFTTLFSGGLVPWYILIVKYLNMKNTFFALLLPNLLSVFNIIIMRTFFSTLPDSMEESAKIDGAGEFTIFTRLMLPMVTPALATVGLFISLSYWNDWYLANLFISSNNDKLFPLQFFLYRVLSSMDFAGKLSQLTGIPTPKMPKESFKLAMTVVATGPVIFLYPFAQRFFIKGITIGAVKE